MIAARLVVVAMTLIAVLAKPALAQTPEYPNRPVTFIVPFSPGGTTGILARLLSQKLEQRLGKPFVVENKPGAGGITGTMSVVNAPSDGHTLIMASSTLMAFDPTIYKNLPFDPRTDLTPIALLVRLPFVLVVNASLPVHSVPDLVKFAREKPGQVTFGTSGVGTFHHLNGELFKSHFGLNLVHVPYKGTAAALNDLAGGHINFMFGDIPTAMPLLQTGKIRALGVTTSERVKLLPTVPPLAEAGIPGYNTSSWHTVTTGSKVPAAIIEKLNTSIREIMNEGDVHELLVKNGMLPQRTPSPAEMKEFVASEIARWAKVIEQGGFARSH